MAQGSDYSNAARQQAQKILSQPPFTASRPGKSPRPLAGVLHAIGRGIEDVVGPPYRWIDREIFHRASVRLHNIFGPWLPWFALFAAVALGVLIAVIVTRRRSRSKPAGTSPSRSLAPPDPRELEEEAKQRELEGDHEGAVRLRFRAGLLRLELRGLIADRRVQTSTQVSSQVHSPNFDVLASRHESIVYARDPATPGDVADARERWPKVLVEAHADDQSRS